MAIHGDLRTMPLRVLLRWAGEEKKSGILEVERNRICKRIAFDDGRIVACSSDDPPARYGQFLISQGRINPEQLREALTRQAERHRNIGEILEEMGALSVEDNRRMLAAKAEENIYSLFDWPDAVFRYDENQPRHPHDIPVDLAVDDVIQRGTQRHDELQRIRAVFTDSGLVLARTARPVPSEVTNSGMAKRILDTVDGNRTLAEVLLHAHATEYQVIRFLYMLHRRGIVRIDGSRPVEGEPTGILDAVPDPTLRADRNVSAIDTGEATDPGPRNRAAPPAGSAGRGRGSDVSETTPAVPAPPVEASLDRERAEPPASETPPQTPPAAVGDLGTGIGEALSLIEQGRHGEALDFLKERYRDRPGDAYLRQTILKAEAAYLEHARKSAMAPSRIPVLAMPRETLPDARLQPSELFLISMIDDKTDVQSLVWVAPMRELEILRTLEQMAEKGLIEFRDPEKTGAGAPGAGKVRWA